VLAVENAPMGIRSVKAAGITCLAVQTTLGERYLAGADVVFPDHRSLFDHIKKAIE
jgi:beta-phosphoglucomutase